MTRPAETTMTSAHTLFWARAALIEATPIMGCLLIWVDAEDDPCCGRGMKALLRKEGEGFAVFRGPYEMGARSPTLTGALALVAREGNWDSFTLTPEGEKELELELGLGLAR